MRRFIVEKGMVTGGSAVITGDLYRHMIKVLRMKPGTPVLLAEMGGVEYEGIIGAVGPEVVQINSLRQAARQEAGGPQITLYQGMPKGDKLEYVLQKSTELGVAEVVPFAASRSIVRLQADRAVEKIGRWQKIAAEAARQSQRLMVPRVFIAGSLSQVLQQSQHSVKLLLWEEEQANRLKPTLAGITCPESIAVLVGPEGGFTPEEAEAAKGAGFIPVTLGKRILRTETAGIAMLAILQFYWGDVG